MDISRQLLRIAKQLQSMRFTDLDGIDTGTDEQRNSNGVANQDYKELLRNQYKNNPQVADLLIHISDNVDRRTQNNGGKNGTMTNGNMYFKYNINESQKQLIIMAFIAKHGKILLSDVPDIINMFKFLSRYAENGYIIETGCNEHSIGFLATFALWKGYYFHAGPGNYQFGYTGDDKDMSHPCCCAKYDLSMFFGANNASQYAQRQGGFLWKKLKQSGEI